jgi:hypothetical protein
MHFTPHVEDSVYYFVSHSREHALRASPADRLIALDGFLNIVRENLAQLVFYN